MARAKTTDDETPKKRGWFSRLFRICLYLGLLALIALIVSVGVAYSQLPDVSALKTRSALGQVVRVRANDGTVIVRMGPIFGEWIKYDDIPKVMVDAMVSVEDKRFRSHLGVDPVGLARATQIRLQKGRWVQGGSTITQQLARNIFLTNSKTFGRKGREMLFALAMERKYSKNEILELYLNRVYFGGGAFGIDAASRRFFGHPAKQMTLSEAAIIAGLVKAPSNYSPTADAQAAVGRAGVVLNSMVEAGAITAEQARTTKPAQVKIAVESSQNVARYFTDWALPQLEGLVDDSSQQIDVWTTLDMKMQNAGDLAIRNHARGAMQGALVSLDRDGAVRAMVGGKDFVSSNYNRATKSVRQPGSSFKLFVYLAAFEAGKTPNSKVIDQPVNIGGWQPKNSSGSYGGAMDVKRAFTYSVNTVAAQIGAEVGTGNVANMARRLGVTTPINTSPSMVLGTSETRVIDMARAYAVVSARGQAITPYAIVKVTDSEGKMLYQHKPQGGAQLIEPWMAAAMTDMMQAAVATGTGKNAQIGRPVAGKTGTTQSNKDGWFIGFSSGLTTAVWLGRDDNAVVPDLQGGRAPALTFAQFMKSATANRPVEQFDTKVKLPDWVMETEQQTVVGDPPAPGKAPAPAPQDGPYVDDNGNPISLPPEDPVMPDQGGNPPPLDDNFIEQATRPEDQDPRPNQ